MSRVNGNLLARGAEEIEARTKETFGLSKE